MKKQILGFLLLILFFVSVSAQAGEAQKIFEVIYPVPCGNFNALVESAYQGYLQKLPDSKLYVIFYGARYIKVGVWNRKTKSHDKIKLLNPTKDEALNHAKEVPLYLETLYKFPKERIVLLNGGFKEDTELEVWIVPKNAEPPKPNPTIDEKDVKFRNGKPRSIHNCARAYEYYEKAAF